MAGTKEIRLKIKSVQNTRKVTRALEMVSASKIRKAQMRMASSRPYARLMVQLIGHIAKANSEASAIGQEFSANVPAQGVLTSLQAELEALSALIEDTGLHMIQLRNLNIDPDLYRASLPPGLVQQGRGLRWLRAKLARRFPRLRFGYFNPAVGGRA